MENIGEEKINYLIKNHNGEENNIYNLIDIFCSTMVLFYGFGYNGDYKYWGFYIELDKNKYLIVDISQKIINIYINDKLIEPDMDVIIKNKIKFVNEILSVDDEPNANDIISIVEFFWKVKSLDELDKLLDLNPQKIFKQRDKYELFARECLSMADKGYEVTDNIMKLAYKKINKK